MKKYAIIVTFEPDIKKLLKFIDKAINEEFNIAVIDNSEINKIDRNILKDKCHLITLNENMGIAYAQNVGVKYAEQEDAQIITFFDQDSDLPDGFSDKLKRYFEKNSSCVVCPLSIDRLSDLEYPSHIFNRYGIAKSVYCKNENKLIEVDIAISSGTTLTMDTFNKIGYYDEDFFIDFVDIEWCIRARKKNIPIFIAPDIKMYHSIGDNFIKTKLFTISSHSPIRTYYKVRNSFLLSRKKVKPLFALQQILPAVVHNLLLIINKKNNEYTRFYLKGLWHGLIGRTGKYLN